MLENIILLSCRSSYLDSDRVYPPLANLYLHSAIKRHTPWVNVNVTDSYNLEDPSWLDNVDGVGISIMTPQRAEAKRVLDFIKLHRPDIKVFAGGPHAKHYFSDMETEAWDHIIPLDGVRVIADVINGTTQRVLRDNITVAEYANAWVKPARLENKDFLREFNYTLNGLDTTTMLTAQGCPMACTFCEDALTTSRWTPLGQINEELDDIVELGYKGVYLFDDLFAIAMPKVAPICAALDTHGLIYRCNGQANFFTKWGEDFAKLLSSTGCVEIAFGHESGSQLILDNVRKRTSVEQNYRSVEYARTHGIRVKSFLMLGLPGETYETIAATEHFIRTAQPDDFQLSIYYPYRGTQIRDALERGEGNVDLRFEGEGLGAYGQKGGSTEAVVRTRALSTEDLLRERDRIVRLYKPASHREKWQHDHFFDEHLIAEGYPV